MPGVSGKAFRSIGRGCGQPKVDMKKGRPTGNGVTTNGGGQGGRVWQRPASSHWILCNRRFPSKPRQTSGITRPMNVTFLSIKLEATVGSTPLLPRVSGRREPGSVRRAWLVEMSYGRIGRWGRSKIRSFTGAQERSGDATACGARVSARPLTAPSAVAVPYWPVHMQFAMRCRYHRSLRGPAIAVRNIRIRRGRRRHVPDAVRCRIRRSRRWPACLPAC